MLPQPSCGPTRLEPPPRAVTARASHRTLGRRCEQRREIPRREHGVRRLNTPPSKVGEGPRRRGARGGILDDCRSNQSGQFLERPLIRRHDRRANRGKCRGRCSRNSRPGNLRPPHAEIVGIDGPIPIAIRSRIVRTELSLPLKKVAAIDASVAVVVAAQVRKRGDRRPPNVQVTGINPPIDIAVASSSTRERRCTQLPLPDQKVAAVNSQISVIVAARNRRIEIHSP
jgi:hypothetical protein